MNPYKVEINCKERIDSTKTSLDSMAFYYYVKQNIIKKQAEIINYNLIFKKIQETARIDKEYKSGIKARFLHRRHTRVQKESGIKQGKERGKSKKVGKVVDKGMSMVQNCGAFVEAEAEGCA